MRAGGHDQAAELVAVRQLLREVVSTFGDPAQHRAAPTMSSGPVFRHIVEGWRVAAGLTGA